MDIRFISTLTPDDEAQYAKMVLAAVRAMLDDLPIAYSMRIETTDGRLLTHTKGEPDAPERLPDRVGARLVGSLAGARLADPRGWSQTG
jgi:hypothetical protein